MSLFDNIPFKKIFSIWAAYIACILLLTLLLAANSMLSTKIKDLKEVLFSVWEYGWDGAQYLEIATKGYKFPNQAFFPLYPVLVYILDSFLPLALAARINIVILLLTLVILFKASSYLGLDTTQEKLKALLVFLLFPTSFFLQANYAETLVLTLSAASLIFLLQKKYFLAAVICAFATAAKPNAVVLSAAISFCFFYDQIIKAKQRNIKNFAFFIALFLLSNIGIISYFAFLDYFNKGYAEFFRAQAEWGRGETSFFQIPSLLYWVYSNYFANFLKLGPWLIKDTTELITLTFWIVMLIVTYKKIPKEMYLYSLGLLLIPLSSGTTLSLGRFALLAFPLILYFSKFLKSELIFGVYILASTTLQVLLIINFLTGKFIG